MPPELSGEKRGEIENGGADELAATPQTVLANEVADEKVDEGKEEVAASPSIDSESAEAVSAVQEDAAAAESSSTDDATNANDDSNANKENESGESVFPISSSIKV